MRCAVLASYSCVLYLRLHSRHAPSPLATVNSKSSVLAHAGACKHQCHSSVNTLQAQCCTARKRLGHIACRSTRMHWVLALLLGVGCEARLEWRQQQPSRLQRFVACGRLRIQQVHGGREHRRMLGRRRHAHRIQDACEGQAAARDRGEHRAPHAAHQLPERRSAWSPTHTS